WGHGRARRGPRPRTPIPLHRISSVRRSRPAVRPCRRLRDAVGLGALRPDGPRSPPARHSGDPVAQRRRLRGRPSCPARALRRRRRPRLEDPGGASSSAAQANAVHARPRGGPASLLAGGGVALHRRLPGIDARMTREPMIPGCLYFQVHQPWRLRRYNYFDGGPEHRYFDDAGNRELFGRVADRCYLPATAMLARLLERHDRFRVAFSVSGCVLEQSVEFAPEVLAAFQRLATTGRVEFLA